MLMLTENLGTGAFTLHNTDNGTSITLQPDELGMASRMLGDSQPFCRDCEEPADICRC